MQVCELNGNHSGAVHCVQFNPKYMMMATACSNMVRLNVNQNLEYVIAISIFEEIYDAIYYLKSVSSHFGCRKSLMIKRVIPVELYDIGL